MSGTLNATTDDPVALIFILGSVLVLLLILLPRTARARRAAARADSRTARQRAIAAAGHVESRGRDLVFRCSRCKVRKLERGLAPGDYIERLTDRAPVCGECIDTEIALLEQDFAS